MKNKILTVENLEQIEEILEIHLPDNAVIEIREMSAEERDRSESGKQNEPKVRISGLVAILNMLRVGDNEFRLTHDFAADEDV